MTHKTTAIFAIILSFVLTDQGISEEPGTPVNAPVALSVRITEHLSMRITEHKSDTIAGVLTRGQSRISFSSRRMSPTLIVVHVQIDDVVLDATIDPLQKTAIIDGQDRALSIDQIRAMQAVGNDLEQYLAPDRRVPLEHEDMLYRVLSFYTMVPPGTPLKRLEISSVERTSFAVDAADAVGGICGDGPEELSNCNSIFSCLDDNGDGISYLDAACDCAFYHVWHDSLGHCFCRETHGGGCDLDSGCLGRGGAGCDGGLIFGLDCNLSGTNGAGTYTIDFLEHDRCCQLHDDEGVCDNVACADEAFDAADDCLFGVPNCDGCQACPPGGCIDGDADNDGDVDLDDFSVFVTCMEASESASGPSECTVFDFDEDGDVDLADFARFQTFFTG